MDFALETLTEVGTVADGIEGSVEAFEHGRVLQQRVHSLRGHVGETDAFLPVISHRAGITSVPERGVRQFARVSEVIAETTDLVLTVKVTRDVFEHVRCFFALMPDKHLNLFLVLVTLPFMFHQLYALKSWELLMLAA